MLHYLSSVMKARAQLYTPVHLSLLATNSKTGPQSASSGPRVLMHSYLRQIDQVAKWRLEQTSSDIRSFLPNDSDNGLFANVISS